MPDSRAVPWHERPVRMMPPAYGEEYVRVTGAHAVTDGFAVGRLIALPPYSLKVSAAAMETPVVFLEPTGSLYAAPEGDSAYPALIAGESAAVRRACRQQFPVPIEAPPTVPMEVRVQSDPPRLDPHDILVVELLEITP